MSVAIGGFFNNYMEIMQRHFVYNGYIQISQKRHKLCNIRIFTKKIKQTRHASFAKLTFNIYMILKLPITYNKHIESVLKIHVYSICLPRICLLVWSLFPLPNFDETLKRPVRSSNEVKFTKMYVLSLWRTIFKPHFLLQI